MPSRKLNDLTPAFRAKAVELIARITEAGIAVIIIDTLRNLKEQEEKIRMGVSWTLKSKHLEGRAIDLAPYEIYQMHGMKKIHWDITDPVWEVMGEIGEELGLTWGGRWTKRDMGHFEEKNDATLSV